MSIRLLDSTVIKDCWKCPHFHDRWGDRDLVNQCMGERTRDNEVHTCQHPEGPTKGWMWGELANEIGRPTNQHPDCPIPLQPNSHEVS